VAVVASKKRWLGLVFRCAAHKPRVNGRKGHFGDLRFEFLNDWFSWLFETNTQFENFAQQNQVNSRKQPFKSRDR
jgi:hypothetical protein